jgi:hypothetical protein
MLGVAFENLGEASPVRAEQVHWPAQLEVDQIGETPHKERLANLGGVALFLKLPVGGDHRGRGAAELAAQAADGGQDLSLPQFSPLDEDD